MVTKMVYMPYVIEYLEYYGQRQRYELQVVKLKGDYSRILAKFEPSANLAFLKGSLGFKGSFYSIPFANIDFSKGHSSEMTTQLFNMYISICKRVEKIYSEEQKNKRFRGAAKFLSGSRSKPRCCNKSDSGICEY